METSYILALKTLFKQWNSAPLLQLEPLVQSGSDRLYFRFRTKDQSFIGSYNPNDKENELFVHFSKHFKQKSLAVPEIYTTDLDKQIYIQEDLGDITLLKHLEKHRKGGEIADSTINYYKKALEELVRMQVEGREDLDFTLCSPSAEFDKQSMLWDFNYFKYSYLKTTKIPFEEYRLEQDFHRFANYLCQADTNYFMFRDFQARNIMIQEEDVYFIDYQGGKKGPLQYDVASLLYQAKANLSQELRGELLNYYLEKLAELIEFDLEEFKTYFYGFVFMRSIQVLGAYGFKGLYEGKPHFIQSIPFALKNIQYLLQHFPHLAAQVPHLAEVLTAVIQQELISRSEEEDKGLTVRVNSFSYRRNIPQDPSTNGGGFVFDCRFIHNPGRYTPYKQINGRHPEVIQFFKEQSDIDLFLTEVESILNRAIPTYLERKYTHLMLSFGCTGGQHRSVYSAEHIAGYIRQHYPKVNVILRHIEREIQGDTA
ncbi:MAG: phosphotransferase [Saprospiraceae bacterium]|nr:phosphotransferase [Saprospiraceae bacterium]